MRRPAPLPLPDDSTAHVVFTGWRLPLGIFAALLATVGIVQCIAAAIAVAQAPTLGGAIDRATAAANQADGVRTAVAGLVLLMLLVLLARDGVRRLVRAAWERASWLW